MTGLRCAICFRRIGADLKHPEGECARLPVRVTNNAALLTRQGEEWLGRDRFRMDVYLWGEKVCEVIQIHDPRPRQAPPPPAAPRLA